ADDRHGILAGVFGAMAMGTQSVVVRLLMRGIPQTNVMTGNMTQLGIETTELLRIWRRCARHPGNAADAREFFAVRARLLVVLSITTGFILGAGLRHHRSHRRAACRPARRRAGVVGDAPRAHDLTVVTAVARLERSESRG